MGLLAGAASVVGLMARVVRQPHFGWQDLFWRCGNPDCGAILQFGPEDLRRSGFHARRNRAGQWAIADICECCGVRGPFHQTEDPDAAAQQGA